MCVLFAFHASKGVRKAEEDTVQSPDYRQTININRLYIYLLRYKDFV